MIADPSPSLDSSMDSFFSPEPPAPDAGTGGGAPPAPEPAEETVEDPTTAAAGEPDDQAPPQPATPAGPPAPAPAAGANLPEGAQMSQDGKRINIEVPRWNSIYAGHKFAQEVQQFAPTVQEAQQQYLRANDLRHMHADFTSGDPQNIDEFLNYWESQSPEGFAAMAARAVERAPAAIREQMASGFLTSKADDLYSRAAETGDPNDLYRARMFEWSHTGQYRTEAPAKPDPVASRLRDVERREQALQQTQQQQAERQWANWNKGTHDAIGGGLNGRIDQMLGDVKAKFADTPELFNALRNQIRLQVIQGVEQDQEWLRNFNLDFRGARRTMSPGDRQALVNSYLAKADQILTAKAAPLIRQATAKLVQQNQTEHARQQRGADRRGSAAPGAPVKRSIASTKQRTEMSLDEKIDADMGI
jgi:glycosidase